MPASDSAAIARTSSGSASFRFFSSCVPVQRLVPGRARVEQVPVLEREAERRADRVGLAEHRACRARDSSPASPRTSCGPGQLVIASTTLNSTGRPAASATSSQSFRSVLQVAGRVGDLDQALVALGEHVGEREQVGSRSSRRSPSACRRSRAGSSARPSLWMEKPHAPASIASFSRRCISPVLRDVAGARLRRFEPITYTINGASRHVRQRSRPSGSRQAVEELREASPSPRHAVAITRYGMASLRVIVSIARSRSSGRTGAKPNPQLPITTDVTPCQPEIVQYGSQWICAS